MLAGDAGRVPAPTTTSRPPPRWLLPLLLTPIGLLIGATNYGLARSGDLATSHPLLLLALNPRNAMVLLVVGKLGALEYYVVGTARLLAADPLFFFLGVFYGDRVLTWAERRGTGRSIRIMRRVFARARWPLVAIMPNAYICLLAGATGMSIPGFLILNVSGTLARLYLLRALGNQFDGTISDVRTFLFNHRWEALAVVVAAFVISTVVKRLRGDGSALGELGELIELQHDLEAEPAGERDSV